MQLRSHPGMTYRGICNWPPTWTQSTKGGPIKTVRGEVGVLTYVFANENISNKCYLVIDHEKEAYIGTLIFSDLAMCRQISRILRTQVGKPIKEIGEIDVSHTL
jgi:hypothetical protein